jgi:hypothetical protein
MKQRFSLIAAICFVALSNAMQMAPGQTTAPNANPPTTPQLQQRPLPSPELQSRLQIPVEQKNQLLLDVVVTGKAGEPLQGLGPGNFEVFDNKKSIEPFQSITSNDDSQILLVIDAIARQAFFRRISPSADGSALIQALDQNVITLSRISEAQGVEGDTEKVQLSVQALDAIGTAESKVLA